MQYKTGAAKVDYANRKVNKTLVMPSMDVSIEKTSSGLVMRVLGTS